jgi:hypothetical protein
MRGRCAAKQLPADGARVQHCLRRVWPTRAPWGTTTIPARVSAAGPEQTQENAR